MAGKKKVLELTVDSHKASEKGAKAAADARRTATWAKTMTKVVISQNNATAPFWHIVNFLGPGKCEPRGIVDLLAVRKNQADPGGALKRGDLFDIILIQVKGGSAKSPSSEDRERLRAVQNEYSAKEVLLSEWTKGSKAVFSRLVKDEWMKLTEPKDLAKIFGSGKKTSVKAKKSDSETAPLSPGVAAAKKAWATRRAQAAATK